MLNSIVEFAMNIVKTMNLNNNLQNGWLHGWNSWKEPTLYGNFRIEAPSSIFDSFSTWCLDSLPRGSVLFIPVTALCLLCSHAGFQAASFLYHAAGPVHLLYGPQTLSHVPACLKAFLSGLVGLYPVQS